MLRSERIGQVSMEFMAYFGILLLIFVAFGPVIFNQTIRIRRKSVAIEVDRIATVLEKEINSAVRFGEGYSRNFTLPDEVSGQDYSVSIRSFEYGEVITVEWSGGVESRQVLASEIDGNPKPGKNTLQNSQEKIIING